MLTAYNGTTISYDGVGNPVSHGSTRYSWEHGRQLKAMTRDGGTTTWNYTYNTAGLRTGRYIQNGTAYKYVYNGSQLVQMTKDNQTVTFTYDAAGTPLTMKTGDTTYYYTTNLQGDITGLVDSNGQTVASYSYTAYGVVTATGDATVIALNPLTYRGYVYDTETGLYYLQSRYYDPVIGRFINADAYASTGQGLLGSNMFAYCLNNPVMLVDRSGLDATAAAEWLSVMWWLCASDGPVPIGEVIYGIGACVMLYTVSTTEPVDCSSATYAKAPKNAAKGALKGISNNSGDSTPPNNNKNKKPRKESNVLNYDPNHHADTVYNKNGIRIDYEYNGNGTGNVHVHTKDGKFYYGTNGNLRTGIDIMAPLAAPQIQRVLQNEQVQKAIAKALKYIKSFGGKIP